jgi:DNA-binding XRE family transcriptional regulator
VSPAHPNRSRRSNAPGRTPKPEEIAQLREEMEITQREAGALLYVSERTWQDWERGERRMPAAHWEYVNIRWAFRVVEQAREVWLAKGDCLSVPSTLEESPG